MIALRGQFSRFSCSAVALPLFLSAALLSDRARAISIVIDYRYDTGTPKFFDTQQKKDTLQAAADRYSAIITTSLTAATLTDDSLDPRIGFTHPSTGLTFQVSPAASSTTDAVAAGGNIADEYRGTWTIPANQLIIYAGGRPLSPNGLTSTGGTNTGSNFPSVFTNGASHVNRGFRLTGSTMNLPVWGGSVAFDSDGSTVWHYNHTTAPPTGTVDLYTMALHEIGHVLGLNTSSWLEWTGHISGRQFTGEAVSAYNNDNGAMHTSLNVQTATPLNPHWQNNAYDSFIFQNASPNFVGSVGAGAQQDLLMEPALESGKRLELTNVDVAALRDVGWSTVPQITLQQPGDFNGNGTVDAADYVQLSKGLANGTFATWRANYGESLANSSAGDSSHVPEPPAIEMLLIVGLARFASRRENTYSCD